MGGKIQRRVSRLKMNSASNKVNVKLSDGRRLQIQVVHLSDPPESKNSKGLAEDYCVIFEEGVARPLLFRVAARNPLRIEPLDLESPEGSDHWKELNAYLKTKT
jgi:hypothetical protein